MGFADALVKETRRPAAGKLERILKTLPDKDAKALREALTNESIPAEAIARALTKLGHSIGGERIRAAREKLRD